MLFTALGLADTYSRPGVRAAAEHAAASTPDALLDGHGTLCIVTPSAEGDRFAPYFTALVTAIIHAAETRAAATGGPLTPRLLLALDEAGNVFRYPRLPHLLTTSRGNGIQLLLVYHDLAQVEHLYGGREVARTVAVQRQDADAAARRRRPRDPALLVRPDGPHPHPDPRRDPRRRRPTAAAPATSTTTHLAPLHLLQQLPDGQAVLLYQNLPPARVRLLPWFTRPPLPPPRTSASPSSAA